VTSADLHRGGRSGGAVGSHGPKSVRLIGTQTEPVVDPNERVVRREWTAGCGAPVVLYSITEGYHVWPGGDPPIGGLTDEDTDPTETVLRLVAGEAP